MKKVLICGATGFIGTNLTIFFASNKNYEVHAVWHKRPPFESTHVTWHQGDLRNPQDVNILVKGMDIIIQAAATTSGAQEIVNSPYIHVTDNAVMNSLLLRAAFEHSVQQFVFFSCTIMYKSSLYALSETDFDPSQDLYPSYFGAGWTKLYIEKMCEFFANMGRTRHTVIRHSNVYGPHDKYDLERSHVFGATVAKVMTASERVVVWGTGDEERDLLHIYDLLEFVRLSLERQKTSYELFNCGLGEAISIRDLVKKIIKISGKSLDVSYDANRPTIKTRLYLDCSKANLHLGWRSSITLDEGIQRTLEWYRDNILST